MAVYCISYDLKSYNYDSLIDAIKTYGVWWHQSESTWIVESSQTAKQIMDYLRNYLGHNDKLIVIQVKKNWWAIGHSEDEYNWMKQRTF